MKENIVSRIRDFYWGGFDENGEKISPSYQREVLSRNKSKLYASLEWLCEHNAIETSDIKLFNRIKACRNTLAHELFANVSSLGMPTDFEDCFNQMFSLYNKIEVWWIKNVELPTNPDFDGVEVNDLEITPGPILMLSVMYNIALGDEATSNSYYDEFKKQAGTT